MWRRFSLVLVVAQLGVGCMKIKSKDEEGSRPQVPKSAQPTPPESHSDQAEPALPDLKPKVQKLDFAALSDQEILSWVRIEFVPLELKKYGIKLWIPNQIARVEWEGPEGLQVLRAQQESEGFHVYEQGAMDHQSNFRFRLVVSLERVIEKSIHLPKDFVFGPKSNENLNTWKTTRKVSANRVFFEGKFELKRKMDLTIEAEEIHILDPRGASLVDVREVAPFYNPSTRFLDFLGAPADYPFGKDGKDGSNIVLKAKRLVGHLEIHLQGGDGWDGKPGEPWTQRAPDGEKMPDKKVSECPQGQLPAGNPAVPSQPGRRGSDGGRGGNAGSVTLEIADMSQAKLSMSMKPGEGGSGGEGSPGQAPGMGGPGPKLYRQYSSTRAQGSSLTIEVCGFGPRGLDGVIGTPGAMGSPGRDGQLGQLCSLENGIKNCKDYR